MLGPLLQYQSLKTVLLHTDANTRFRISAHMPSIRDVEKVVPLKISSLDISYTRATIVNDAEYEVGIFRHFPKDIVPLHVALKQNVIGSACDFDEFGFPFTAGRNVVLPGDVLFQLENRPEVRRDTEKYERGYRYELRIHEEALKMQAGLRSKGITVEDYLKSLGPIPGNRNERKFEEEARMRQTLTKSPTLLSDFIEECKLNLIPFDCRRNNTKTPFTCYIQLTIKKGEIRQIHRFEYNKRFFAACKYLNEALFGRRTVPIEVERLDLDSWNTVYRLPVGFRLHAKHVRTTEPILVHASFLSLVENSERLDTVAIASSMRMDAFQSQIVRRANHLVVEDAYNFEMQGLSQIIQNLSNLGITLMNIVRSPEETFSLIQAWLSADRPVGAFRCLAVEEETTPEKILRLVQTRYERTNRTNRRVTIQKTNSTKVEVFSYPFQPPYSANYKWMLKTRIVKV